MALLQFYMATKSEAHFAYTCLEVLRNPKSTHEDRACCETYLSYFYKRCGKYVDVKHRYATDTVFMDSRKNECPPPRGTTMSRPNQMSQM